LKTNSYSGGKGNGLTPPFSSTPIANGVNLINANTIDPEPTYWLWTGYLALGHLTVLAGEFNASADTLVAEMAAIFSKGGILPDGTLAPSVGVFVQSNEHSLESSIARTLAVAEANTNSITYIRGEDKYGRSCPFEIAKDHDFEKIKRKLSEINSAEIDKGGLLIVSMDEDTKKKSSVRRRLVLLREIAEMFHLSVLVVVNVSRAYNVKLSIARNLGSPAFVSEASLVLVAAEVKSESGEAAGNVLARGMSRIGPNGGGFGYRIRSVDRSGYTSNQTVWEGIDDRSLEEIIGAGEDDNTNKKPKATDRAAEFLTAILAAHGSLPFYEIMGRADEVGISEASIRRAKPKLPIFDRPEKGPDNKMRSMWHWADVSNQPINGFITPFGQASHSTNHASPHFPVVHETRFASVDQVANPAQVAQVAQVANSAHGDQVSGAMGVAVADDENWAEQAIANVASIKSRRNRAKGGEELTPMPAIETGTGAMASAMAEAKAMAAAKAEAEAQKAEDDKDRAYLVEYNAAYAAAYKAAYAVLIDTANKSTAYEAATNAAYAATRNADAAEGAVQDAVSDAWDRFNEEE
jgi:putative DNA primase/helicase